MEVRPDILEKLLCSVCGQYLSCAPVRMKNDGSMLCGRCCDPQDESTLRITPYELVAQMLIFPCANNKHGCTKTFSMADTKDHEEECKYRQYVCPLTKTGQCDWSGAMKDILEHCQDRHQDNLQLNPGTTKHEINDTSPHKTSEAAEQLPAQDSDNQLQNPGTVQPQITDPTSTEVAEDSLPAKSKAIYEKVFKTFVEWKSENAITDVNETVMMAYFKEMSEKYTPNSMWSKYSILKSTLLVNDNVDIARYKRLVTFLKQRSKGYVPKKSKVLTGDQVMMFLKNARNETYLLHKVVLVMGVFGGLKREEMVKMTIEHIEDKGCVLLVKVPQPRSGETKAFAIMEEHEINALELVRQYIALRPVGLAERRFFLTYRNNHCTAQPVGKNSLGSVPSVIAKYLKLDKPNEYTGHCLRRMSSKFKSTSVADSMSSKIQMTRMITSSAADDKDKPSPTHAEEFAQVTIKQEFY